MPAGKGCSPARSARYLRSAPGRGGTWFHGPAVESLTLTEPETPMLRRLERKAAVQAPGATVLRAPAEDLPFEDAAFDVAVSTLVLCGVDDQPRALRELRRVLRPGGQLPFIEHVRSGDAHLARSQDRMNGINRFVVGCDCNRPTLDSIRETGLTVTRAEHMTLPKVPKFVSPAIVGSATVPARCRPRTRGSAEEPGHDHGRRQVLPLSAAETAGRRSGRPGLSAWAVMTLAALAGSLPGLEARHQLAGSKAPIRPCWWRRRRGGRLDMPSLV